MNAIRRLITVIRVLSAPTHLALTNARAARDTLETVLLVTDTQVRFFVSHLFGNFFLFSAHWSFNAVMWENISQIHK